MKKTIIGSTYMLAGTILFAVSINSASLNLSSEWIGDRLFSTIMTSPLLNIMFCFALFHWVRGINILWKEFKDDNSAS